MGSLAAGSAAAMGTGAFTAAQINDRQANIGVSADDEALIQLIPGSEYTGTVSENRVGMNDDGELYISFDDSSSGYSSGSGSGAGINADSFYQVGSLNSTQKSELSSGINDAEFNGPNPVETVLASDTSIVNDPAFAIRNASDNTRVVELSYDAKQSPDSSEATGILGLFGPDATGTYSSGGAAVLALGLTDGSGNAYLSSQTTAELAPGKEAYAVLLVETDDVDVDSEGWKGSLRINAGQKARLEDTINNTA